MPRRSASAFLLTLSGVLLLAGQASAQIYRVAFKDQKRAKSFSDHCIEVNDELFLVGEAKSGIRLNEEKNQVEYINNGPNELWVADMDDPSSCPYKLQKGELVRNGSKAVAGVDGPDIANISIFIRGQSLYGLSREYARREGEIDELKKQREACKRGTPEWKLKQSALIQTMQRMKSWLDQTLYTRAAKKFTHEIESEMKAARDTTTQRFELARQSIKKSEPPDELTQAAREVYGEDVVFHWQESEHCHIAYDQALGDGRIAGMLELAESLIEGFRVLFIDPYVAEDFPDYLPDKVFVEWCFGPNDVAKFEQFCKKYYGLSFAGPEAQKKLAGHCTRRAKVYIDTWSVDDRSDLEGMVAHQMGHHLVNIDYNQDRAADVADWLYEGVGNWLSLEYLGRNNVQCVAFEPSKYTKKAADNNVASGLLLGTAEVYHRLALEKGLPIDQLALRKLYEFDDPAVAKSYSVFNFIAKTQGEKGQRWLRACCEAADVRKTFIAEWRKKSEELFQVTGVDVFKKLGDDWARFAQEQIDGSAGK